MTIDTRIRTGAALNDPETRKHVEDHIINAKYTWSQKRGVPIKYSFNIEGVVNILSQYPWEEFHYKYGRWQKRAGSHEADIFPFLRSWTISYIPLQLLDARTGSEVSQVAGAYGIPAPSPTGGLLFAGDPHYAGVISVTGEKGRFMSIVGSNRLAMQADQYINVGHEAAELAKVMSPDRTPDAVLHDYSPKYLKTLGPWIADHPEKPPRKGVAGTLSS